MEGCLSVPGVFEEVFRFQEIKVSYQDVFGSFHYLHVQNLLSFCIQHELDHINGTLFIDKLSLLKKRLLKKKTEKKQKNIAK